MEDHVQTLVSVYLEDAKITYALVLIIMLIATLMKIVIEATFAIRLLSGHIHQLVLSLKLLMSNVLRMKNVVLLIFAGLLVLKIELQPHQLENVCLCIHRKMAQVLDGFH